MTKAQNTGIFDVLPLKIRRTDSFHFIGRVNLDKNLSLAKGRLTEKQKKVLEQLWEKYFR